MGPATCRSMREFGVLGLLLYLVRSSDVLIVAGFSSSGGASSSSLRMVSRADVDLDERQNIHGLPLEHPDLGNLGSKFEMLFRT